MPDPILFVWDFHGVLEKGCEYGARDALAAVLPKFKIEREPTVEECRALWGLRWQDFMRFYNPEADDKTIKEMVECVRDLQKETKPYLKYIQPQDYAEEVLSRIRQRGHLNILISNTHQSDILFFTDAVRLTSYFNQIIGVANDPTTTSSPEAKAERIMHYSDGKSLQKIVVIGDTRQDIEAGNMIDATTLLFRRDGDFPETKAHYLISDLREVLREL